MIAKRVNAFSFIKGSAIANIFPLYFFINFLNILYDVPMSCTFHTIILILHSWQLLEGHLQNHDLCLMSYQLCPCLCLAATKTVQDLFSYAPLLLSQLLSRHLPCLGLLVAPVFYRIYYMFLQNMTHRIPLFQYRTEDFSFLQIMIFSCKTSFSTYVATFMSMFSTTPLTIDVSLNSKQCRMIKGYSSSFSFQSLSNCRFSSSLCCPSFATSFSSALTRSNSVPNLIFFFLTFSQNFFPRLFPPLTIQGLCSCLLYFLLQPNKWQLHILA